MTFPETYRQRGISLVWTAVFVALVSMAAIVALMSWRHERNLFAEGWQRLAGNAQAQAAQHAADWRRDESPIRQCRINGKLTYSNVECEAGAADSREVELHFTRGIEPPAVPAKPADASTIAEKMIERQ